MHIRGEFTLGKRRNARMKMCYEMTGATVTHGWFTSAYNASNKPDRIEPLQIRLIILTRSGDDARRTLFLDSNHCAQSAVEIPGYFYLRWLSLCGSSQRSISKPSTVIHDNALYTRCTFFIRLDNNLGFFVVRINAINFTNFSAIHCV